MTDTSSTNAAGIFFAKAALHPDKLALVIPKIEGTRWSGDEKVSYGELVDRVRRYQAGWKRLGYKQGDRLVLIMRPSVELYAVVISMIGLGMVPVFIDTGMSRDKIAAAIEDSKAKAIIGVRKLMRVFWLFKPLRHMPRYCVEGSGLGYQDVRDIVAGVEPLVVPEAVPCTRTDHGLISFTSGSTGRPKGADRTHYMLIQQHLALRDHWPEIAEEVDCNCFPVMVLHNLCCGITTVMPRLDLAAPATVQPSLIVEQIRDYGVTRFSGAPAYMAALCQYAQDNDLTFPDVRDVMTGGATVPMATAHAMHSVFPNAQMHVLYGSTEAEPIGSVDYDELVTLDGTRPGYLVGRAAHFVDLRVARLGGPIDNEQDFLSRIVPQGESGEVCVSGPHVLARYVDNPEATRENKIPRENGMVWHRTGDTGYLDEEGRLWLTGRMKDVITAGGRWLEPFPLEKCLDEMPGMQRSALMEYEGRVVLVVQAVDSLNLDSVASLLTSGGLTDVPVYRITRMPVDGRHNSKIDRPLLRQKLDKGELALFGEDVPSVPATSKYIVHLNKVDLVTLSSVVTTAIAAACAIEGYVFASMSILFLAMIADAMDGILARKLGLTRNFGRYLDGFMDVLIYLVTPALVMYQWGFNGLYGVFIMLYIAAGCVRLSVFNEIGNVEDADGGLSYLGMPVFWSILILAMAMLTSLVVPLWLSHALLAAALTAFSYYMVYRRPFFKFKSLVQILSVTLGGAAFFAFWQIIATASGVEVSASGGGLASQFWTALYLAIPVIVGGVLHMIVVTKDLYPQLKIPVNKALFGANKTWRGFVVVPLCTMIGMLLLYPLERLQQALWGHSVLEGRSLIALGLLAGLAYVVAELPNSFMKRRLGIAPGETPQQYKYLFILMDQLDSIAGVALLYCVWLGYGIGMFFLLVLQSIVVALLVKRLLFMARLKKAPA